MVDGEGRAFDRAEWHEGQARALGQPREHAFAHAELFLLWLERRDLSLGASVEPRVVAADALTDEGRAFTDAYYGRYLDDYAALFADRAAYAVAPDEDAFDQIARVIDQRYAEWVYAGRPELPPEDERETLARLIDDAPLPPELNEAAVLGMSPDQVIEALEQMLARRRGG
jgi:hypothetical protein